MELEILSIVIALLSLLFAFWLSLKIRRAKEGNQKMKEIAQAIKEGAMAFLSRQYKTIAILALILALIIFGVYTAVGKMDHGIKTALAFIFGAFCSALAGYIGMHMSVRTNLKTAQGAAERSLNKALTLALQGGAVSGITIVALSLLGVAGIFYFYRQFLGYDPASIPSMIVGYGFGASFVALFAQLGGGIYTKAADIGADLVGKIEAGIPEDDPRNPAVIADLVGDNVGDCAGRGADLFESTAAENVGAMIIGVALYPVFGIKGILFPLVIRAFGLIASMIGILVVRIKENGRPMSALNRGYYLTSILAAVALYFVNQKMLGNIWFFYAGLVGIVLNIVIVYLTQYYTEYRYRPVKSIAQASETGPATNILAGFSVGLENTALPVLAIAAGLFLSYKFGSLSGVTHGGLYGTAIATMGMLASCAYILAMDTFGPITDNAGGIMEMSQAPEEARIITDKLDAVGNTTKALTKGYAVGTAAMAAFLLFSAYLEEAKLTVVDLTKIEVFIGAMIGAMLIFLFSAFAIRAVGKAAYYVINEVRRQFKENPGIMAGTQKPDYAKCVDIVTKGALKQMVLPGLIAVLVPIAVGLILRAEAAASVLMIGTVVGVILALVMNNAGAAWDNAKKFIEAGLFRDSKGQIQGKKTPVHAAAVVGDMVGDPFKDTAGPSLHVLIKLLSTLTLVLAALFV